MAIVSSAVGRGKNLWLTGARRLVKDYELKTESSEAMIEIRMISVLLKRLKPVPDFSD